MMGENLQSEVVSFTKTSVPKTVWCLVPNCSGGEIRNCFVFSEWQCFLPRNIIVVQTVHKFMTFLKEFTHLFDIIFERMNDRFCLNSSPCLFLAVSILQLLEVQISPLGPPGALISSCDGYMCGWKMMSTATGSKATDQWALSSKPSYMKQGFGPVGFSIWPEAALEVKEDRKRHHSSMLYCF